MRSWFCPLDLNYGGFRRLRGQLWLALQFSSCVVGLAVRRFVPM